MPHFPSQVSIRLAILLCILLGASTMGFNWLYRNHLRSAIAPKMGETIGAEVRNLHLTLHSLPPSSRNAWLAERNTDPAITLEILPGNQPQRQLLQSAFLYALQTSVREYSYPDTTISARLTSPNNVLFVDFTVDDQEYRLTLPAGGFTFADVWPFAWLIASNVLIVWIGVAFAVWQINKPLQRSAAALSNSANRLAEIDMPSSAPAEFHIFAERFNHLARKMMQQERERSLLLAGVSHDLRAPLTRIRLRAELIADDHSGIGKGLILDSESMRRIIDQFLDYQRGVTKTSIAPADLRSTIDRTVQRYRDVGRVIEFEGDATATVSADPAAIERILSNLIDNALSYGKEPIEIQIICDSGTVIMGIRDHGPGIAEPDLHRLLQPFERLDQSRHLQGHCGLGLAIVDRIVNELNGILLISNHPDGGLRIQVKLPISGPLSSTKLIY